jgi:cytochrome c-type biogenesis protein CcmE
MRSLLLLALLSVAAFAADVTGTWQFNVETDAGSGTPTFVLRQTGEELTGTYSGALGEARVKGSVKGDKVEITFQVSPSGDAVTVVYSGTLDGEKKMKGTVKLGDLGSGTFTAQKN